MKTTREKQILRWRGMVNEEGYLLMNDSPLAETRVILFITSLKLRADEAVSFMHYDKNKIDVYVKYREEAVA